MSLIEKALCGNGNDAPNRRVCGFTRRLWPRARLPLVTCLTTPLPDDAVRQRQASGQFDGDEDLLTPTVDQDQFRPFLAVLNRRLEGCGCCNLIIAELYDDVTDQ